LPGKLRRRREVFRPLEEKYRNGKFQAEVLHRFRPCLGDETISAKNLAIEGIVQVLHGVTGSN
jgi:hypothetical protein